MPSESAERRAAPGNQMGAAENHHFPLPCPRCDSTNTKFCYYNNYNFSQPRHFCKSCRRYWTHGGTLRDIPIGGGTRKSAKRSRTSSSSAAGEPISSAPVFVSLSSSTVPSPITAVSGGPTASSFTSLLNSTGPGVLPLSGFSLGLGLEDVGFGLGRGVWALPPDHQLGIGYANGNGGHGESGGPGGGGGGGEGNGMSIGDTWQVDSGESDFGAAADCFGSLPELAISTPGNALK